MLLSQFVSILTLLYIQLQDVHCKVDITKMIENPLAHGFGDDIDWVKWDDAIETALDQNKPIFLLIHKSWCHACKALKKTFQQSNAKKAFKKLSQYFVMVNTEDDEEPFEEEYRPDGKYIPRLLFLDKNGDVLTEFKNKKAEYKSYSYYYSSPADILNSMKDVLKYFDIEIPETKRGGKLRPGKGAQEVLEAQKKAEEEKERKEAERKKKEEERKKEEKRKEEERKEKEGEGVNEEMKKEREEKMEEMKEVKKDGKEAKKGRKEKEKGTTKKEKKAKEETEKKEGKKKEKKEKEKEKKGKKKEKSEL